MRVGGLDVEVTVDASPLSDWSSIHITDLTETSLSVRVLPLGESDGRPMYRLRRVIAAWGATARMTLLDDSMTQAGCHSGTCHRSLTTEDPASVIPQPLDSSHGAAHV